VASLNLGAESVLRVIADTAGVALPLVVELCATDAMGNCLGGGLPSASVQMTIAHQGTPTFSVFLTASGPIPFDPARHRIRLLFLDSAGEIRGATSVAVRTP
jgi:hypothetical protein